MQRILRQSGDHVTLKVLPGFRELAPPTQVFLRAHFSYDPVNDTLIPAKEAGLKFQAGDILQVRTKRMTLSVRCSGVPVSC